MWNARAPFLTPRLFAPSRSVVLLKLMLETSKFNVYGKVIIFISVVIMYPLAMCLTWTNKGTGYHRPTMFGGIQHEAVGQFDMLCVRTAAPFYATDQPSRPPSSETGTETQRSTTS